MRRSDLKLLRDIRYRAKKAGLDFNLTEEDVQAPELCPALGIKMERGRANKWNSPSVDRIIPAKGYVKGNVVIVSFLANTMKNHANVDQIERLASFYRQLIQPHSIKRTRTCKAKPSSSTSKPTASSTPSPRCGASALAPSKRSR